MKRLLARCMEAHCFCVSGLYNLQVSRLRFLVHIWVGISSLQGFMVVCVDGGNGDMVARGFGGGAFRSTTTSAARVSRWWHKSFWP
ncbi:uncharacterized protein HKW66_Vig0084850 [Vigna angularis]|uniref:Uncharacterized protein n=1 Tax=Phaseolus angularis TaxID=3914 RepID=A0A8T0KKX0_PHAAN|nr:uncharacterized protein HKW66_Vig0084850 [Vigna angularis]